MKNIIKRLCATLLSDEHGINEDAYDALLDAVRETLGPVEADNLSMVVDATEGRFYFGPVTEVNSHIGG